jgi:hypothetical protein
VTVLRSRKNRCFTESALRSFTSFRMTSEGFSMTPHSNSLPEVREDNLQFFHLAIWEREG